MTLWLKYDKIVEVGDKVLASDPETGETAYKEVLNTYIYVKDTLVYVTVDGETIETTKEHPFWVKGQSWTKAKFLETGDQLRDANGNTITIDNVKIVKLPENKYTFVYNFEVADFHTYYVADSSILVHNTKECLKNHSVDVDLPNRRQAFNQAKDLAGIPRSQQPIKQWIVGGEQSKKGMKNYSFSSNKKAYGRFYQYETPKGPRVIVEHTEHKEQGLHFHAGKPKGGMNLTYDFKKNRYQKIDDPNTGDHHVRYK